MKKNPRLANVVVSVLAVGEVFDDFFLENWKKIVTDSLTKKKTEEIPFEIVNAFSGIAGVCSYYFKNFRAKDARELWVLAENWFDCLLSKKEKKEDGFEETEEFVDALCSFIIRVIDDRSYPYDPESPVMFTTMKPNGEFELSLRMDWL